jgi:hypothetical protein
VRVAEKPSAVGSSLCRRWNSDPPELPSGQLPRFDVDLPDE